MNINQLIKTYRQFLLNSWSEIELILRSLDWDESPHFLADWMQANWELLVEKQCEIHGLVLVPYGYDTSPACRYKGESAATHKIICAKEGENEFDLAFLCFVSNIDGIFRIEPPFDLVEVDEITTGERTSVPFDALTFRLQAMS